jgi:hypothetical protein
MKNIKKIDIKEFRELGFLQELNRQFLHPMGFALEVIVDDETGEEQLGGIWDYRYDPEGIIYDIANSTEDRIKRFTENANYVEKHINNMIATRIDVLGYGVEQIPIQKTEYEDIIDYDGISLFEKYLREPDENIIEMFNKIKYPIKLENNFVRLYQDLNNFFVILFIDYHKNGFTKTYQKDDWYIDLKTMELKKRNENEKI